MIKFVRKYNWYGSTGYDVVYENNRLYIFQENELPKTVATFIQNATRVTEQRDPYHGFETIYEA